MHALHDLMASLSILAATAASASATPAGGSDRDVSALLKRQTQAFSEAGQAGDKATLAKYLDPDVVFMNETGEIVTKADMVKANMVKAGGASPPKPTDRSIEVTDWALRIQGGGQTATATFVDVLTQHFHGQTLVYRFRSTETWARRPEGWKMIASQTMNVQRDPPAVQLSAEDLNAYVGVYQADPDYKVTIARSADGLTASTNGSPPMAIQAELRDVFFLPGIPNMRRIFQRDGGGQIAGYVSRRDGVDIILSKVGRSRSAKAWLFCGSDRGGERAAVIYSLIAAAKLNDVDPRAGIADILGRIAGHPAQRLDES